MFLIKIDPIYWHCGRVNGINKLMIRGRHLHFRAKLTHDLAAYRSKYQIKHYLKYALIPKADDANRSVHGCTFNLCRVFF